MECPPRQIGADETPDVVALLDALLDGSPPPVASGLREPPSAALAVFEGRLEPGSLDPSDREEAFASWLGPALLPRLVDVLDPLDVGRAVELLVAPPLAAPWVLRRLADGPVAATGPAWSRLESLLGSLPSGLPSRLLVELGLPGSLGASVDGLTFALEAGASLPTAASATHPLSLALERLGVPSVWDLLPARRGGLAHRARDVPVDLLVAAAASLNLLGAPGCVLRLTVLVLLLGDASVALEPHRRLLTRLLLERSSRVPTDRVVDVWSLANR